LDENNLAPLISPTLVSPAVSAAKMARNPRILGLASNCSPLLSSTAQLTPHNPVNLSLKHPKHATRNHTQQHRLLQMLQAQSKMF
jgi:hypothetical protein